MESDDYEDHEITWEDADDMELRRSRIQKYIHMEYEPNCGLISGRQRLLDFCTTGWHFQARPTGPEAGTRQVTRLPPDHRAWALGLTWGRVHITRVGWQRWRGGGGGSSHSSG